MKGDALLKLLIGYSMRSGSTLLQHVLGQHSHLRSYSDLSSLWPLAKLRLGWEPSYNICVKPLDLFYLHSRVALLSRFTHAIWIARDPRDSYLSAIESGYAYLLWRRGRLRRGIDVRLLKRWKRVHAFYFRHRERWHLVRYEDLVRQPGQILGRLLEYLGLPCEKLLPFEPFSLLNGGDHKLRGRSTIHSNSLGRHKEELTKEQSALFKKYLSLEMKELGYL
jgi:hypothetical protein